MLVEITVENFKSIKNRETLTLAASHDTSHLNHVAKKGKMNLLKSAAIYGPNAGGKSNFIKAFTFMKFIVIHWTKTSDVVDTIPVDSFRLDTDYMDAATSLEIVFFVENIKYRYGFEITKAKINKEWLFASYTAKESLIFLKSEDKLEFGSKFKNLKGLSDLFNRENALFLSFVNQTSKIEPFYDVLKWFSGIQDITALSNRNNFIATGIGIHTDKEFKKRVLKAMEIADISIEDIIYKEEAVDDFIQGATGTHKISLKLTHSVYKNGEKSGSSAFDFEEDESEGTKKFFSIIGPILDTIDNGSLLILDEFDSKLHPNLMNLILELFNSDDVNSKGAQIIFTTHNSLILKKEVMRRDQIWFIEKDTYGASTLFSLYDYDVRKDASFDKDYLMGKFGAVPILSNFKRLF